MKMLLELVQSMEAGRKKTVEKRRERVRGKIEEKIEKTKGKGQAGSNKGGSNKKPTPQMIAGIISQIPNNLKQNGECDKFARVLAQKLREVGIAFDIIRVDTVARYIYSDKFGNQIGNNSFHYGIRIGNLLYDNLTTKGLEFGKWLSDLGADGSFADTTWKIVNEILSR